MKTTLVVLLALGALLVGCPTPAKYGTELAVCLETSKSWAQYEPCCIATAHRYQRDPSFCLQDAGAPALSVTDASTLKDGGQ